MTPLRQRMLHELQRRNYSPSTIRGYIGAVRQFAEHSETTPSAVEYRLQSIDDGQVSGKRETRYRFPSVDAGERISGSVAGIPCVGLCVRVEMEGLLVWLDRIAHCFPTPSPPLRN